MALHLLSKPMLLSASAREAAGTISAPVKRGGPMRISILGVDYRNAIFAGCLSFRGHRVIGFDPSQSRADWLNHSTSKGLEAGLEVLLEQGRREGRLSGTTDLGAAIRDSEITFFDGGDEDAVGAGSNAIEALCREVGEAIRKKPGGHRLLVRSSRSKEQVLAVMLPILESVSGKRFGRDLQIDVRADYLDEYPGIPLSWEARQVTEQHGSLA